MCKASFVKFATVVTVYTVTAEWPRVQIGELETLYIYMKRFMQDGKNTDSIDSEMFF